MRREKRVLTPDDFYPTSDDGRVTVSIHKDRGTGQRPWRVAVWGNDDFGLELDGMSCEEAFKLYHSFNDGLTISKLQSLGFRSA